MAVDANFLKFLFGAIFLIFERRSDKRFISIDVKHSSIKLRVSPPKLSSVNVIVHEKPIPFISMKMDVGTQADLYRSENRDLTTILLKFVKSFIEQNPQLTKIEEDRSINMEMKLAETVAQENLENHYLAEAINVYNTIVKSENEDKTISTNDNVTFFGYGNKNFVKTIEKCPLEIKDIKYQKKKFCSYKSLLLDSRKDKICLKCDIFAVEKPKPVRGYNRLVFSEEMKNILPKPGRVNFFNKLDNKDLEACNLGEVKSQGVYKKIRSEIFRENDLSSDDLEDLRKRYAKNATEEDQFFQYLAEPCEVGLFSRNQVKVAAIAKYISEGALVITNYRGKNYPVAERIASTHDAGSIADMMERKEGIVKLQDVDTVAVKVLVDYIYSGVITLTEGNVEAVLSASDLFQIVWVKEQCAELLRNNVNRENCFRVRKLAEMHSCKELQNISQKYILDHLDDLIAEEDLLLLSFEEVFKESNHKNCPANECN
uniref:BTB domain-containing protein n=1 Tax=Glossina palpalis gambiensis TaxID=67801 RepID=A0A1B0BXS1_9MUSC